jgi:Ni,Fe-hydrogenase III large subunit
MEIERSISFARSQLISLPPGPVRISCPPPAPGRLALAITEGWRGEVVHVAVTIDNGAFARYKIIDPSFHN